eukprot:6190201-Pleurochrysis_carterae.AAC.2
MQMLIYNTTACPARGSSAVIYGRLSAPIKPFYTTHVFTWRVFVRPLNRATVRPGREIVIDIRYGLPIWSGSKRGPGGWARLRGLLRVWDAQPRSAMGAKGTPELRERSASSAPQ